tara:strand:+ start:9162 stop:11066 length:1905 start_codon:yes stop_codon:yes gene_type:complete
MVGIQKIRKGLGGFTSNVIVIAIIITFVGFVGWPTFFESTNSETVISVDNSDISISDLNFELNNQTSLIRQQLNIEEEIDNQVLTQLSINSLIQRFSLLNYIFKRGMNIPDKYVFFTLKDEDFLLTNGKFDPDRFDSFARSNGFIPGEYLKRVKEDISLNLFSNGLIDSFFSTKDELSSIISLAEQTRDISFINIPLTSIKENIEYSDDTLLSFYDSNISYFQTPKKAKFKYIYIDKQEIESKIEVEKETLEIEYESYLNSFDSSERKRVSHIELKLNEDRSQIDALQTFEEIKNKLAEGIPFGELVKDYSEDAGTVELQGDLGFTDGSFLPEKFELALASMNTGDISEVIVLESSLHLLKVTENNKQEPKNFEEAREELRGSILASISEDQYLELLDRAIELRFNIFDIEEIANQLDVGIESTEFLTEFDLPSKLKSSELINFLFSNIQPNEPLSEVIELDSSRSVLVELLEFEDSKSKEFDEVKSEVINLFIDDESQKQIVLLSESLLTSLNKDGATLSQVSKQKNLTLDKYLKLSRNSSLLSQTSLAKIFSIPRTEMDSKFEASKQGNGDYIIFKVIGINSSLSNPDDEVISNFYTFYNDQKANNEVFEFQKTLESKSKVIISNNLTLPPE